MTSSPGIFARGPWAPEQVRAHWREDMYEPPAEATAAADAAITALAERGSPSHDGLGARFVSHREEEGLLVVEMQPARWGLRLVDRDASQSMAALCVTRAYDGRWLAGRRSAWLSTWAGRWALGAGGAVDVGESPAQTLTRELHEEWQLTAERVQVEALVRLPHHMIMVVGQAWLPEGAEEALVMDDEHDAHAWWPASIDEWPAEADEPLRRMAGLLSATER
ncbi:NUDIX hydrolase [Paraconexibacter sp.]|uniref:NUDIX hydrolase n=1 Tax=Paraconexibacter sp. TaxID=2949640 RepID=UPI0035616453